MQDYRKLAVWRKGHSLALDVYRTTSRFPKDELFGLTSQMRRAAASIPANVAEGCGRSGNRELARFLHMAVGSAGELEYHVMLATDLAFLDPADGARLGQSTTEVKRMLSGLIRRLGG